jgi:glycosyltransferase involved in cell wall biosynthesis
MLTSSGYHHDLYVTSLCELALLSERLLVIPNGVDTTLFSAEGPALRPAGSRKCVFLFVGGAIRRKGVDVLLESFKATFDDG